MKFAVVMLVATITLGLFALPLAVAAQQARTLPRVICLFAGPTSAQSQASFEAFRQGLRERGYVDGQNIVLEVQRLDENVERLPNVAAEVVRRKPDVIVTASNAAVAALKQATRTVPIVAASFGSPVEAGLVASLAKPGGNITGLSTAREELYTKWLELVKETVPSLARVGVLEASARNSPTISRARQVMESAGQTLGLTVQYMEVGGQTDITRAFAALNRNRVGALIVLPAAVTVMHRRQIVDLAATHRLPAMYVLSEFIEEGGLMAYGPDSADMFRRAAYLVERILRGTKPADLPVEQPTKFELVINLKTAKALGLTIPASVLARADRVVE